jgi:hypothetical protein
MFGSLTEEITWSLIIGIGMTFLVHFIYWWYLFFNADKTHF